MGEQSAQQDFDLAIIGGGPGGYVAAIRAGQLGLRTALVEKERAGGVCLNWGCIPTKAMLRSADVLETIQHADVYGVMVDKVGLDYSIVLKRKDKIVKTLTDGVAGLLKASKVTVFDGHARFTGPNTVEIVPTGEAPLGPGGPLYNAEPAPNGKPTAVLSAKEMIIATGSTPAMLPIPGADLPGVITSDGAFMLKEVPRRIIIVGGSAVGAEWATMFHAFGSEVTIVELLPSLVPLEDAEIGKTLGQSFKKRGIDVQVGRTVAAIEQVEDGVLRVTTTKPDGGDEQKADADVVLIGVGRRPNTAGLDLEKTGVSLDRRGFVEVDDQLRTSVGGLRAIGDVTGKVLLAHVASHQGLVAVGNVAGHPERMDYKAVPAATFTHPEVASVGLSEAAAKEAGHEVITAKFPFTALGRALTYGTAEGFFKIVAEAKYREVLGVHIIGPGASDLIPEGTLAMAMEGTLDDIASTIHAHPTLGEGTMETTMVALGLPIHIPPPRRR
jgi:dihydrolipoamide dehydrogenase